MHDTASGTAPPRATSDGIPDLKWINRALPIADVARKLEFRFGERGMIHCWHPERHQHGDRTPSVSIRQKNNTIHCFGCGTKPMSVVDLVVDARRLTVADAARWLEQNFEVRRIKPRKHLAAAGARHPYMVGMEQPVELLVRSCLWAHLSVSAQRIVPVLLSFAERAGRDTFRVEISYRGMMRYSGVRSFNAVSGALDQLADIGWLQRPANATRSQLLRDTGAYVLTPYSDVVKELGNTLFLEERQIIQAERELRDQQRRDRRAVMADRGGQNAEGNKPQPKIERTVPPNGVTKYESLYSRDSVDEKHATPTLSPELMTLPRPSKAPAGAADLRR
jgi:hypothetical protein